MLGTYEHTRDSCDAADCWHVRNDACAPHFHSSIELVYVTHGELQATLGGHLYNVHENQVLISPSFTVHYYHTETKSDSIVLVVPLDFIPSYKKMFQKKTFRENLYQDSGRDSELYHCLDQLSRRIHIGSDPSLIQGYIYVALGLLAENVGMIDLPRQQERNLARDILVFLGESFRAPITLSGIAGHFGYSESRFSHIFGNYFGCSLNEFVNTLRCHNAVLLLTESGTTLIDAALSSGFESMRTFYRSFKRCYGLTPTQYLSAKEYGEIAQNAEEH